MKKSIYILVLFLSFLPFISQGQQALNLMNCEILEYAVNDHTDSDNDGDVCETMVVLSNSASYLDNEICQLSSIQWTVFVDTDADGTDDLEFSSSLPASDNTLDDTNNNGIPDRYIPATVNGEIQSIALPDIGGASSNHNVTWTVSDDCNLGDNCNSSFSVQDKRAPTPYCSIGTTVIFDGSTIEFLAEDFNVGSFDNCTEQSNLRFSFSPDSIVINRIITCDDVINSPVELRFYVWDEFDNVDYCTFSVNVIPEPFVDCYDGGEIKGTVKSWKGVPLEGIEVILDANALEYPRSTFTDVNGKYSFGFHENGLNYSLSAAHDIDYLNGASTLDLVIIQRHLLGLQLLLNPYQILASDINGDNTIKVNDLLEFRKLILGIITEISTNTSWKFLRSDFEFVNPTMPFLSLQNSTENPFQYEFNALSNSLEYDFIGIKIGDVNN